MRCKLCAGDRARSGFTLVEVLAAFLFMAIVIPVALQAVQIANLAGQVAERKATAARIADQILNEQIVTGQWSQATPSGTIQDGPYVFRWQLHNDPWPKDNLRWVWVQVTVAVQGQDYEVRLSTLVDSSQP